MPRTDAIPRRRHYKRTGQAVVTLNGREIYLTAPYCSTAASLAEHDNLIANWLDNDRRLPAGIKDLHEWMRSPRCARSRTPAPGDDDGPLTVWELATLFLDDSKKQFTRPDGQVLGELDKLTVALRPLMDLCGLSPAEEHILAIKDELSPTLWTMVQVQWKTGMRSTELCSLRIGNIDMGQAPWIYEPRVHKTQQHGKMRRAIHIDILHFCARVVATLARSRRAFRRQRRRSHAPVFGRTRLQALEARHLARIL